jgi:GNAT superfamily N-acetyltransferase
VDLVSVTADTVEKTGFFCRMSKMRTEGNQRKLRWLRERFAEGLRITMLPPPERGYIEYLPGEAAWRAIHAGGLMVIHCVWVVGKSKGKGLGRALLESCEDDARRSGMDGVAMLTSEGVWLADKGLLESSGYEQVDREGPFSLMLKRFGARGDAGFAGGWEEKRRRLGDGLTVVRADQCPYIEDAARIILDAAAARGIHARTLELHSRADVLTFSPTPYGVFGIVRDGRLLSYHYLTDRELAERLQEDPR